MISANTLFHFTNSLDNLLSILTIEFQPRFCLEDFSLVFADETRQCLVLSSQFLWFVFVTFHVAATATFICIWGLWDWNDKILGAKTRGCIPVLYLHKDSLLVEKFARLLERLGKRELKKPSFIRIYQTMCLILLYFVKPYEGCFSRDGRSGHYRFYDEREWRSWSDPI